MLALAMFFGATSHSAFHKNQKRLEQLFQDTVTYKERLSVIEQEVARRNDGLPEQDEASDAMLFQQRLL